MNAFTLFGELKADTRNFEAALIRAEREISDTQAKLTALENQTKRAGQTSATTARQQEKLNETLAAQKRRLADATSAYDANQLSHRKMATVLNQTSSRMATLNGRIADNSARLRDWKAAQGGFLAGFAGMGTYATLAGTAIGGFAIKASMGLENARNRFTALEGSVEKANARIQQLLALSRRSVGVNFDDAVEGFGKLQVLGTVGEESIFKMIQALGKLQLAFAGSMGSSSDFLLNLQQLFDQGFEAQDWKQAIGRVQIFEQLMEKAFGTKDPEKLRQLKEQGKLTMDSFMAGFAEAANNDSRLAGLNETFSTKLSKALTELNLQLAPLGDRITNALRPVIDTAMEEFAKPNPNYVKIGQQMGEQIGKGLNQELRNAFKGDGESSWMKQIGDFYKESGLVGSIAKGALKDAGYTPDFSGAIQAYKNFVITTNEVIADGLKSAAKKGLTLSLELVANVSAGIATATPGAVGRAFSLGAQIAQGLANGIGSGTSAAITAATNLAIQSVQAAQNQLQVQSPSRVFFEIGGHVAQGFINGIEARKEDTQAAMKSVLDLTQFQGKGNKAGVDLAKSLTDEVRRQGVETKLGNVLLDLQEKEYAKLDARLKEYIITKAKEVDIYKSVQDYVARGNDDLAKLVDLLPKVEKTPIEELAEALESAALQFALANQNAGTLQATINGIILSAARLNAVAGGEFAGANRDSVEGAAGLGQLATPDDDSPVSVPPPPIQPWQNFWDTLQQRMRQFRAELPSFRQAIGENLVSSLESVATTFGNMFASFDGTLKSLWQSLLQGLRQTVSQIIGELMRLAAMRLITQLFGSLAGGIGGAFSSGASAGTSAIASLRLASGGMVAGRGTSTSDSIPAMLSNGEFVMSAKSVRQWGRGFFENLNSGFVPPLAMASGGMVGSSSSTINNHRTATNNFHINVQGGSNPQQTGKQIAREAMMALQREERRNG